MVKPIDWTHDRTVPSVERRRWLNFRTRVVERVEVLCGDWRDRVAELLAVWALECVCVEREFKGVRWTLCSGYSSVRRKQYHRTIHGLSQTHELAVQTPFSEQSRSEVQVAANIEIIVLLRPSSTSIFQ